jgi:hypothetical protein
MYSGKSGMKRKNIFASLAVIVVALLVWAMFPKPWLGFAETNEVIGTYHSFVGCEREVEKLGGWCGKNCSHYGSGVIADCSPLLKISKSITR